MLGYYQTLFDGVIGIFTWAWDNGIAPVLDKLGLLDPVLNAWNALQEGLGVVLDWISAKFNTVMTAIKPVLDGLKWVNDNGAAAINSVTGGNKGPISSGPYTGGATGPIVPGAAIPGVTVPDGARALGGPVRAGLIYRWQEEGRELFMPRTDGNVISNRQLRAMQAMAAPPGGLRIQPVASAGPGARTASARSLRMDIGGITIHAAPGMTPADVARAVRRELETLARSARFDLHDGGDYA
ncbi:hypothetical protein [Paracoccus shanxieyensis]|uniref:Phage tail tape measure protein n=1 Tax=Paracoccus shanxieyensis TaxID=2675752 RepID=A0A6L6J4E5_9RHOB|nr:hypothetical protein [Paracoccus shanxieyensis]MTH65594.1 hypothetical protein [Paracoccus shanxieyensis]MTH88831.1 hypothetical protein [Paracoccus shanxieyensis]